MCICGVEGDIGGPDCAAPRAGAVVSMRLGSGDWVGNWVGRHCVGDVRCRWVVYVYVRERGR